MVSTFNKKIKTDEVYPTELSHLCQGTLLTKNALIGYTPTRADMFSLAKKYDCCAVFRKQLEVGWGGHGPSESSS